MALVANFISYNSSARIQEHQRRMKETFSVCDYSTICRWWQWGSPRCLIYISLSCAVERQTELIYRAHVWQGSIGWCNKDQLDLLRKGGNSTPSASSG